MDRSTSHRIRLWPQGLILEAKDSLQIKDNRALLVRVFCTSKDWSNSLREFSYSMGRHRSIELEFISIPRYVKVFIGSTIFYVENGIQSLSNNERHAFCVTLQWSEPVQFIQKIFV